MELPLSKVLLLPKSHIPLTLVGGMHGILLLRSVKMLFLNTLINEDTSEGHRDAPRLNMITPFQHLITTNLCIPFSIVH